MNIYKLTQSVNTDYDTYNGAIVVAATEDDARLIRPDGAAWPEKSPFYDTWVRYEQIDCIQVVLIGRATAGWKAGSVVLASFNE